MAASRLPARFNENNALRKLALAYDRYREPPAPPLDGAVVTVPGFPMWITPQIGLSAEVAPYWTDSEDIAAAALLMRRFVTGRRLTRILGCVYVMRSDGPFCKVGISTDPLGRLASISTSSPYDLSIGALVWVAAGSAVLEKETLNSLKDQGVRVVGEWAHTDADHAIETALRAAASIGSMVAPADLMLRGLIAAYTLASDDEPSGGGVADFVNDEIEERRRDTKRRPLRTY